MRDAFFGFGYGWRTAIDSAEGSLNACGIGGRVFHQAGCHRQCTRRGKFAVEQSKNLWRDGRCITALAACLTAGSIEDFEHRVAQRAYAKSVNGAPIALGPRSRRDV